MRRTILGLAFLGLLAACARPTADLDGPVEPLGDFRLGFSEVVAPNLRKLLISEEVSPEEWTAALDKAVEDRFGRFQGERIYHFGISVEEYSISVPVPFVPGKSAVAVRVTVWDDKTASKLNPETEVISVIKVFDGKLFTRREDKIRILSEEVAAKIEDWLRERQAQDGWFGGLPGPDAGAASASGADTSAEGGAAQADTGAGQDDTGAGQGDPA